MPMPTMVFSEPHTASKLQPMKRRKLLHTTSSTHSPSLFISPTPQVNPKPGVCTSCHRAFPGAKQSQLIQCARCYAMTCMICSRTCNGVPPPSVPPTPELTMSSASVSPTSTSRGSYSPDEHTLPLPSDMAFSGRRPALASHTNMAVTQSVSGKRRKVREFEQQYDRNQGEGERRGLGHGAKAAGVRPGCERVICRECSFETPESDLNTCYDCAGCAPDCRA